MTGIAATKKVVQVFRTDAVLLKYDGVPFRLADGHPLQAVSCLVCRNPLSGALVITAGVIALPFRPASCGCVSSDFYLLHAACQPEDQEQMQAAISGGLHCRAHFF